MALLARRGRLCGRGQNLVVALGLTLGFLAVVVPSGVVAADIEVTVDEAKLIKLPERVATLVIGNPLIADATVQNGGVVVITGKGYGATNFIALDRTGAVLMERHIEVIGRADVVVVYKGVERETYSCAPVCQRRNTLGDTQGFFDNTLSQTIVRNGAAQTGSLAQVGAGQAGGGLGAPGGQVNQQGGATQGAPQR